MYVFFLTLLTFWLLQSETIDAGYKMTLVIICWPMWIVIGKRRLEFRSKRPGRDEYQRAFKESH
jgi:hypothetical protein